jgi:hypothetical protein
LKFTAKDGENLARRKTAKPTTDDAVDINDFSQHQLNFSKLARVILQDLNSNNKTQVFFNRFKREDVVKYLLNPERNQVKLREMSNYLYIISSHYRRLINYVSKLYLLDYIVEPYFISPTFSNDRTFLVTYQTILQDVERMSLKHEMQKAQILAWKNDVCYGYVMESKDSFYIKYLDPAYCQISSVEDGCYCYSFNMGYFDGKDESVFASFPDEFLNLYKEYQKDITVKWFEIDPKNTFCLKVNEDCIYPIVPFCGVFEALYDIEEYKSLKKARTNIGNYKFLSMIMPLNDEKNAENPYLIDPNEIVKYYNRMAGSLPDEIGLLLSPTELKEFSFDKESINSDKVNEATTQFWNTAGVSELLMSGNNATGASLAKSVVTDEAMAGSLIVQIERNLNKRLKKFNAEQYKFKLRILPTTVFNWQDMYDKYSSASKMGYPTKLMAAASLGITQGSFAGLMYLENTILALPDNMKPVQNSNNMGADAGEDKTGAPKKKSDELTDEGEKTRDNDTNNTDSRNFTEFDQSLDEIVEID